MVYLKKVYRDELLQLAIILSLLGADRDPYRRGFDLHSSAGSNDFGGGLSLENAPRHSINNRNIRAHPKSMDSILLSYERDVLEDLNALGRYNRIEPPFQDVTAYVLNVNSGSYSLGPVADLDDAVASGSENGEPSVPSSELTQEVCDQEQPSPQSKRLSLLPINQTLCFCILIPTNLCFDLNRCLIQFPCHRTFQTASHKSLNIQLFTEKIALLPQQNVLLI